MHTSLVNVIFPAVGEHHMRSFDDKFRHRFRYSAVAIGVTAAMLALPHLRQREHSLVSFVKMVLTRGRLGSFMEI